MSKKQYDDLMSQAKQYEQRAADLRNRANRVRYEDMLEDKGFTDGQVVMHGGRKVALCGADTYWFIGYVVLKNGNVSGRTVHLYNTEK